MSEKKAGKKSCVLVFLMVFLLVVASIVSYARSDLTLDASRKVLYQNIEAETILKAYVSDAKEAAKRFHGKNYVVWGKLSSYTSDYTKLYLADVGAKSGTTLFCSGDGVIEGLEDLKSGDMIKVYGQISIRTWPEASLTLDTLRVEPAVGSPASQDTYNLLDGTSKSRSSMKERAIGERDFVYYIPDAWTTVEYSLPNVPGYQYKLNNLSGKGAAESLFVFYVDSSYLEKPGDIDKTTQVQKAIIRNILGNDHLSIRPDYSFLDSDISMSSIKADYCTFTGYAGWYEDPNHHNYRVEFLFPPAGEDGVRVLLYVYDTGDHVNDILFLMRMIEI